MHAGSSFTSALTALGVGSALLVYVYNKDIQKCQKTAKVVGYFIVIAALASMLCSAAAMHHCYKGKSCSSHGGVTGQCPTSHNAKTSDKDECCLKKGDHSSATTPEASKTE